MKTETEIEIDHPSFDGDRTQTQQFHHQLSGSNSFKEANEEREPISARIIAPVPYGNSNPVDNSSITSLYTSSNDSGSASSPTLSSSSPIHMTVITSHSPSTKSDSTLPVPPAVAPTPAPFLSSPAPTRSTLECPSNPTLPCLPRKESLQAEGVASKSTPYGRQSGGNYSAGKKAPKSVSRLCFPFVTTSPKRKDKEKEKKLIAGARNEPASGPAVPLPPASPAPQLASSPRQHKYSCAPTQFSPFPVKAVPSVQKRQRHAYANRGYSHEALDRVKSFWNMRREGMKSGGGKQYMEKDPQVAGTVHPGTTHQMRHDRDPSPAATWAAASTTATATDPSEEMTVPASIHPRRGDISALRDPQCAEVDRTFGALSIWTIAKMVWMVEVDVGMGRWEQEQEKEERRRRSRLRVRILWDEESDEEGPGSLALSTRSTSMSSLSDDSEMTLVEDDLYSSFLSPFSKVEDAGDDEEDADDALQLVIRGRKPTSQAQAQCSSYSSCSGLTSTPSLSSGRELDFDQSDIGRNLSQAAYQTRESEWTTDWMSRWEIIKNLSRPQIDLGYGDGSGEYNKLSTSTLIATSIRT